MNKEIYSRYVFDHFLPLPFFGGAFLRLPLDSMNSS